ncbi:MAG: response regulator [Rhodospirillales bacterium]|nr:response regulator [Rhodospirillales bacterium]
MSEAALVLVVDDDPSGRYARARLLRSAGYETLEAAEGAEALALVAARRPDIVLLDVRLPDMSGFEVCRRIKEADRTISVLQISAVFTRPADRVIGLDSGADGYLADPIDPLELLATLRGVMRLRRAEQQLSELNETLEERIAQRTRELAEANRQLLDEMHRRELAENALRQAQKLEALGQLTGAVAHDFNNLLTVIRGNLEVARARLDDPERLVRHLEAAQHAVERGEQLTNQLLAFSRLHPLRSEEVDVDGLLQRFVPMFHQALGEGRELVLEPAAGPCRVRIDPAQFEAALLNLAVNARDAMPSGGRFRIATSTVIVGSPPVAGPSETPPGEYLQIEFEDTGTGMPPEVLERAFEPFFTTKAVGKGSGLGLAQVYGFAKQSHGHVSIRTAQGSGTTIVLLLPSST